MSKYQQQLYNEAALIVQGREAFLHEAGRAWARVCGWLGLTAS